MGMQSDLSRLTNPALREETERYESFRDGGGGMVKRQDVICSQAELTHDGDDLVVHAQKDGAQITATCRALGFPNDWKPYGLLTATFKAPDERVLVEVSVLGARNRIPQAAWIEAGSAHTFTLDLGDLPLAAGTRPPFEPTGLRIKVQWGDTWESEGEWIKSTSGWQATANNTPIEVKLLAIALEDRTEDNESLAVVDRFGQRIRGQWPTKVSDPKHFEKVKEEEAKWLAETKPPQDLDRFGGWAAGPKREATGFFRVEQIDGRWWYIDPDGNLFWSVGTTGIRVSDTTQIENRDELFEELPDRKGDFGLFYTPPIGSPANEGRGKEVASFYLLNILKKYGSLEAWRDQVIKRFKTVGYNTFGNWSDELMMAQKEVPHTRALTSRVGPHKVGNGRLPDVFSHEWIEALDQEFAEKVTPHKDNPWLLGYFVDNELDWNVGWSALRAPQGLPIRSAFAEFLREFFKSNLNACRDALGLDSLHAWEDLAKLEDEDVTFDSLPECLIAFAAEFAERYFRTINETLKKYDPNHLYLGCRFVRNRPHDVVCAAAGRYCDVVTVNCYSRIPERWQFEEWHKSTGRPIQIGEHHLPLRSERQLPPLYPAFTSDERRESYEEFLHTWADQPYSLGAHWFQHADQNATGRPVDGENQTVGFVDIVDRPHPELVGAAMAAARNMYSWHSSAE